MFTIFSGSDAPDEDVCGLRVSFYAVIRVEMHSAKGSCSFKLACRRSSPGPIALGNSLRCPKYHLIQFFHDVVIGLPVLRSDPFI